MTSLKTLLFGTTLAAGAAFFMGTTAHADEAYTVQSGDTYQRFLKNTLVITP